MVVWYTDFVSNLKLLHLLPLLHNLAHKLMPADEVGGALEVAAVEVQVGAAEGGGGDFEDGVGGVLEFGVGPVFDGDLVFALEDDGAHC